MKLNTEPGAVTPITAERLREMVAMARRRQAASATQIDDHYSIMYERFAKLQTSFKAHRDNQFIDGDYT